MKNESIILGAGVGIIALLVIARFLFTGTPVPIATIPPPTPTPIIPPTATPPSTPPLPPAYPEDPSPVRPRPANTVCDTKNFICVGTQLVNATLINPLSATGTAIAFESTFQWKLENASGTQIAAGTLMASAPDIGQPGPFTLNQTLSPVPTGPHTLTLYESSAKDGAPTHILAIPVAF